ncbi:MAG: (2Fe-2S)-binding protein [Planctomycetota bacterium]|nr:MAG: (2Fe-2S)-binding protein [Planctomycetota bacterium]
MSVGQEIAGTLVCHCFEVTEEQVRSAIDAGKCTLEDISSITSAGDGCMACVYRLRRLLAGMPAMCNPPGMCSQCGVHVEQCVCQVA